MRVLLDVSAVPGQPVGAGVYTANLAEALTRRDDVELHLLARSGDDERWPQRCPGAVVHAVAPRARPLRLAWEQARAGAIGRAARADVWHGPHYTMPLRLDTPAAVTVHDLTFFDHPEWHERTKVLYFRRMIRASARRARVLVAVSEHTAARLLLVAAPRAPVVVAPHGVDHERFRPTPGDDAAAADLARLRQHGVRPPYVAFAGTLEPRKDVPTLVHAFARVALRCPQLRLVLAGRPGWGAEAVRAAVEQSGIATRVSRPGYLPDDALAALYRRAVVVAYPSREEGFGLPALEALACGAALVTTTGSAMEEFASGAAVLVPPGDVDRLAAALAALLDDPARRDELARAGPERAAAFTWEASASRHVEAYRIAAGVAA